MPTGVTVSLFSLSVNFQVQISLKKNLIQKNLVEAKYSCYSITSTESTNSEAVERILVDIFVSKVCRKMQLDGGVVVQKAPRHLLIVSFKIAPVLQLNVVELIKLEHERHFQNCCF